MCNSCFESLSKTTLTKDGSNQGKFRFRAHLCYYTLKYFIFVELILEAANTNSDTSDESGIDDESSSFKENNVRNTFIFVL